MVAGRFAGRFYPRTAHGAKFAPSPLDQWKRVISTIVTPAEDAQPIHSEEVDMVSAGRCSLLTVQRLVRPTSGSISRLDRPCVTEVMMQAANRCEVNTGAIVFAAMGEDAADDGRCITDRGGIVWAQDAASGSISSTSDATAYRGG